MSRAPRRGASHVLFLQGMPCHFFKFVAAHLEAEGCQATSIVVCLGDWACWYGRNTVHYRGSRERWPEYLADYIQRTAVTDIVLLGEQRIYHQLAIPVAHRLGVRVNVTDFGYLRPDWLTLERDGMNGASRFPRDPEQIRALARQVPEPDFSRRYEDSFWNMARGDMGYSFGNFFLGFLYPRYRGNCTRPNPWVYFPAMGRRLLTAGRVGRRAQQQLHQFLARALRYYVLPLQLDHDFQIVAYSPFARLEEAIDLVFASFAQCAAADTHLVVKVHPWDPLIEDWSAVCRRLARAYGIASRVVYLDGGDLDLLLESALGTVTVNSTTGIRSLQQGIPVKVLGQAVYDIAGLTHQGALDAFWSAPQAPDAELVHDWVRALAGCIQVRGVFFNEPGADEGARAVARRLLDGTVGEPVAAPHPHPPPPPAP